MASELIGAWRLISSISYRDGVGTPVFGDRPTGQIQYTEDGRMSAFLMDPAWALRGETPANSLTEFFAYGGHWRLEGDSVRHFIEFSSVPVLVRTQFVRTLKVLDWNLIELETAPEISKSGATFVTRLVWRRYSDLRSQVEISG